MEETAEPPSSVDVGTEENVPNPIDEEKPWHKPLQRWARLNEEFEQETEVLEIFFISNHFYVANINNRICPFYQ